MQYTDGFAYLNLGTDYIRQTSNPRGQVTGPLCPNLIGDIATMFINVYHKEAVT
jgi:hypothetical protein